MYATKFDKFFTEMPLHTDESTASNLSQKHLVSQNEENEEGTMSGLTEKYTDRRPNAKQNGDIEVRKSTEFYK